ncbi:MAG: Trk system potassium transporter TrkA [Gammaproteobacteria bacterium]|nr:Trk system potassium transporter TrkA [Gammaproteobacteria bacterium]
MNIIILGAGQVGSTVAANLAHEEANEITIIDRDVEVLQDLQDRLDVRTVHGLASHPDVLEQAGIADADMVIALTNSDETNMIACQVAYTLFHTPTKIARVRSQAYSEHKSIFVQEALPVDVVISPETLVTDYIERLINYPGTFQVVDFAGDKVRLAGVRAQPNGPLVGHPLRDLSQNLPNVPVRVAAIYRGGVSIDPDNDTVIRANDEVFFIASRQDIRAVMGELRKLEGPARSIVIAGGGNIGYQLARRLENTHQVKVIERDRKRARAVAQRLANTIVLSGDATDEDLLTEESADRADIFIAVTDSEEANILSAMLTKRLGTEKTIALINKPSYADLVELSAVDIAVSPELVTLGALLAHVRRGDITKVHWLRRGAAEAIEGIAHGDRRHSPLVGRTLSELKLPAGAQVVAVVRGEEAMIANDNVRIEANDHVIVFMIERKHTRAVEKLFQVSVSLL